MSKLASFLEDHKITQAQFAETIGVHQTTISRLCAKPGPNRLTITVPVALKIEKATGGVVQVSDWAPASASPDAMQARIRETIQQRASSRLGKRGAR